MTILQNQMGPIMFLTLEHLTGFPCSTSKKSLVKIIVQIFELLIIVLRLKHKYFRKKINFST
jgi:hypothetical protein